MKKKIWIGASMITALAVSSALPAFAKSARIPGLASGDFSAYGDVFHVTDTASDGRGAYIHWSHPSTGRRGTCADTNGANNGTVTCNYNFPENTVIYWKLCVEDNGGSKPTICTSWITDGT